MNDESNTDIPVCETQAEMKITHRNLPHWKKEGAIYWITFRLADSIPQPKLQAWKKEFEIWSKHNSKPWDEQQWKDYNQRFGNTFEEWLDAGTGSCALARPDVRETLISCMLKFNGRRLVLHSAVIMPNHVHCLMELEPNEDISQILKGMKGASAKAANILLGTSGRFWMEESYDHIVRSEEQYAHFLRYIEENPERASLQESEYWLFKLR